MLIEPLLGYKSTWRVLNLLFETPRKPVGRSELYQYTKLGNAPLSRALERLVRTGILIQEKKGKKEFYYINENNEYAKIIFDLWKKETFNLRNLPYNIKLILSEFLRSIQDSCEGVERMVLFGSQAKGTASAHSDIDVAVIFHCNLKQELLLTKIVKKIKEQFGIEIQVHSFTAEGFNSKNKLVEEIKRDGIDLTG